MDKNEIYGGNIVAANLGQVRKEKTVGEFVDRAREEMAAFEKSLNTEIFLRIQQFTADTGLVPDGLSVGVVKSWPVGFKEPTIIGIASKLSLGL